MERKSIYMLLNDVCVLGRKVKCAFEAYKKGESFYRNFEDEAVACFEVLKDVFYLSENGYDDDIEHLYHIYRIYKRH